MIEQLITVYIGAAIIGITYIAWLLSGAFNVAYSKTREWSWRRFWEDLLKVILRLGFLGTITIAITGIALGWAQMYLNWPTYAVLAEWRR